MLPCMPARAAREHAQQRMVSLVSSTDPAQFLMGMAAPFFVT
jgi:hypothetical protein